MVTDPPYGVNYDPTWRHDRGITKPARVGKVKNDDRADWTPAWQLFKGAIAYVWHAGLQSGTVMESLQRAEFAIRAQIIWAKERLVLGRGDYQWQHEPCWYAVRKTGNWVSDRKQTTLWSIPSRDQDAKTIHGTQKPVECMRRPMLNHTMPGDTIYEPFLGSGTTLIAAESCGRVCCAIEIDPVYIDVAVKRWQSFAGSVATLATTGQSFDEVAMERAASHDTCAQTTSIAVPDETQPEAPPCSTVES
jgi:DNA modification methylase